MKLVPHSPPLNLGPAGCVLGDPAATPLAPSDSAGGVCHGLWGRVESSPWLYAPVPMGQLHGPTVVTSPCPHLREGQYLFTQWIKTDAGPHFPSFSSE